MNRIYTVSDYLKTRFGSKVVKLSLDGGFTCPNRDGSKGKGGCIFCSEGGSGELAGSIEDQIELLSTKWPNVDKFIAYFQSHSSTYAPVEKLERLYYEALSHEGICGIAIATRPDCLDSDVLNLLKKLNKRTHLWIELGLQTIHDETSDFINRCYPLSTYADAVNSLNSLDIRFVTHLILGLPSESKAMMFDSLDYVCKDRPFGIKLHLMNLIKNSPLYRIMPEYCSFQSIDEYVNLVVSMLRKIPADITIHRLTGDVPRKYLKSPEWSYKKRTILNSINKKLVAEDIRQGDLVSPICSQDR